MSEEFPVKVRRIGNFYVEGFDLYLNSVFYGILEENKVKKLNSFEMDKLFYYLAEKNNKCRVRSKSIPTNWFKINSSFRS